MAVAALPLHSGKAVHAGIMLPDGVAIVMVLLDRRKTVGPGIPICDRVAVSRASYGSSRPHQAR